ncbi:MAG: PTS sugar transporter subunit IIA [Waddliaceae bacterium]
MTLTLKDVANLLNVNEETVDTWLVDGKIPAFRIKGQPLFNRSDIEMWVMDQKGSASEAPFSEEATRGTSSLGGTQQFCLFRAIHKGNVYYDIPGSSKDEIIKTVTNKIASSLHLDGEVMSSLLLEREAMQSTALGNGLAIPHARDFLLTPYHQDIVTIAFPKEPIEYHALDGQPVHTLIFLFASSDKRHLHLLSKVAHLASNPEAVRLLKERADKERILDFVREWESKIKKAES